VERRQLAEVVRGFITVPGFRNDSMGLSRICVIILNKGGFPAHPPSPVSSPELKTWSPTFASDRMQAAKLKLPPGKYENYVATCNRYNGSTKPVHHKAYDDPYSVDWVDDWSKETLFPDEVSRNVVPGRYSRLWRMSADEKLTCEF